MTTCSDCKSTDDESTGAGWAHLGNVVVCLDCADVRYDARRGLLVCAWCAVALHQDNAADGICTLCKAAGRVFRTRDQIASTLRMVRPRPATRDFIYRTHGALVTFAVPEHSAATLALGLDQ